MEESMGQAIPSPLVLYGRPAEDLAKLPNDTRAVIEVIKESTGCRVRTLIEVGGKKLVRTAVDNIRGINPETIGSPRELTVKWFDARKGYGFLLGAPEGKDVFFHSERLREAGINIHQIIDGVKIWACYGMGPKDGKLQASKVFLEKPKD